MIGRYTVSPPQHPGPASHACVVAKSWLELKSLLAPECIVRDRREREQSVKSRERCPRVRAKRVARVRLRHS